MPGRLKKLQEEGMKTAAEIRAKEAGVSQEEAAALVKEDAEKRNEQSKNGGETFITPDSDTSGFTSKKDDISNDINVLALETKEENKGHVDSQTIKRDSNINSFSNEINKAANDYRTNSSNNIQEYDDDTSEIIAGAIESLNKNKQDKNDAIEYGNTFNESVNNIGANMMGADEYVKTYMDNAGMSRSERLGRALGAISNIMNGQGADFSGISNQHLKERAMEDWSNAHHADKAFRQGAVNDSMNNMTNQQSRRDDITKYDADNSLERAGNLLTGKQNIEDVLKDMLTDLGKQKLATRNETADLEAQGKIDAGNTATNQIIDNKSSDKAYEQDVIADIDKNARMYFGEDGYAKWVALNPYQKEEVARKIGEAGYRLENGGWSKGGEKAVNVGADIFNTVLMTIGDFLSPGK